MATIIARGGRNPVMVELDRLQAEARRKEKKTRKGDAVQPPYTDADAAMDMRRSVEKAKAVLRAAARKKPAAKKKPARKRSRK